MQQWPHGEANASEWPRVNEALMGLRDLFKAGRSRAPTPTRASSLAPPTGGPNEPRSATTPASARVLRQPEPVWLPAGEIVQVDGRSIAGGMVYVGSGVPSLSGYDVEPCLIDPSLSVHWESPDWAGETMNYWPAYDKMNPRARAAFLTWLADGRRNECCRCNSAIELLSRFGLFLRAHLMSTALNPPPRAGPANSRSGYERCVPSLTSIPSSSSAASTRCSRSSISITLAKAAGSVGRGRRWPVSVSLPRRSAAELAEMGQACSARSRKIPTADELPPLDLLS